ncbi:MAG: hypothetical protein AAFO77_06225 [Pseudomonadota bacterium]
MALTSAHARDLGADDKAGLVQAIKSFDAAMRAQDFDTVIDQSITPKMMEFFADQAATPVEQLRPAIIGQLTAAMSAIELTGFSMDTDAIVYDQTSDGTQYALIDTVTNMIAGAQNITATSQTLGFREGDSWYLVRVSDKEQADMFKAVYPSFASVNFPAGKMEMSDK